jgi:hypothetical protein
VRDLDRAFVQQVLDVPQRERITDVHHRQADDLGLRLEDAEDAGGAHPRKDVGSRFANKPVFLNQCPKPP